MKITLTELQDAQKIVYSSMLPTPQICWPLLSERIAAEVWVKHENHTAVGAFKIRGGLNFMTHLHQDQPDCPGVITATRGNHGQSVALAAAKSGMTATIVVPFGNNPEKNTAMKALGGNLIEYGEDFQEAKEYAMKKSADEKLLMVPSFHPWLVAGVGTYSLEFLRSVDGLHTVYVPIGQGSGICGMISARDALGLDVKIVGVVAENAACYALSFAKGTAVSTNSADTLADGLACRVPDDQALGMILKGVDRIVSVSEDEILQAMGYYFTDTHNLAEGAAAAPLAALMQEKQKMAGRKVGLILSGGNSDRATYMQALSRPAED